MRSAPLLRALVTWRVGVDVIDAASRRIATADLSALGLDPLVVLGPQPGGAGGSGGADVGTLHPVVEGLQRGSGNQPEASVGSSGDHGAAPESGCPIPPNRGGESRTGVARLLTRAGKQFSSFARLVTVSV